MRGIVSTTMALPVVETPNIKAAAGQEVKTDTGTSAAQGMESSFKKKLQDCQAMSGPDQQTVPSGNNITSEDGVQENSAQEVSGVNSTLEGFEMPAIPTGETAAAILPQSGTVQSEDAQSETVNGTPGQIAWTQNTTAGQSPVKTQDQILETVGVYLDAAAGAEAQETVPVTPQVQTPVQAQTAAQLPVSPTEKQTPEVAIPAAADAAQTVEPAVGTVNPQPEANNENHEADAKPGPAVIETTVKSDRSVAEKPVQTSVSTEKQDAAPQVTDKTVQPLNAPVNANTAEVQSTAPSVQETAPAETQDNRTSLYARENVLRIVDKVSTHAADGKYDFDVELKPDFLGKVSIKVTMEGDSIRMHIKTDDMSVKGMLADQTNSLQSALKDKGITLTSVDVSYENHENQASLSGQHQPYQQQGEGGKQGGVYYAHQAETVAYEPATEAYGGYYVGNSSVEFLA